MDGVATVPLPSPVPPVQGVSMPEFRITVTGPVDEIAALFWAANSGELEGFGITAAEFVSTGEESVDHTDDHTEWWRDVGGEG